MTPAVTVLLSVSGSILIALLTFLGTLRTIRANRPKTDADAALAKATANQTDIEALRNIIGTLQGQVDRGTKAAVAAEDAATAAKTRARDAESRLDAIESDLTDAHEQNELLSHQLAEARETNRLQRLRLEAAQKELEAVRAELEATRLQLAAALRREAILTKHAAEWSAWYDNHRTNGDDTPPPQLLQFEEPH